MHETFAARFALSPPSPYAPAFQVDTPRGLLAGVHIPPVPGDIPEGVLAWLHPDEREHARGRRAFGQVQFVGGRLAMASVLDALGVPGVAVLPDAGGAPVLPDGLTGSISHKRDLAVAAAARGTHGLGIDLEETRRRGLDISPHALCDDEREALDGLDGERRWMETITRFSIKEAAYKALHRFEPRRIGLREVAIWPDGRGGARVEPRFDAGRRYRFVAQYAYFEGRVLTIVEAHAAGA